MALYQKSVLNKYLKQQDNEQLQRAYKKYTKYFLSPAIQENIRNTKEEQYQGLFLTELFVKVLDYSLKPNIDFNLVAEYKNQNNARKADGAILKAAIAIGVIELKGTKTKDLESIRRQAFDYKANQKGCVYVITSNFEKLRFYINDATEFEEFNLFELTEERFALLYLCLQKDNILTNLPLKIKEASIIEEDQITKSFYKDYSLFKRELYRDLVKRNGKRLKSISYEEFIANTNATEEETTSEFVRLEKNVKLTLFKKSQKLIDRFLFIFFSEDRGLLPPNSTVQILNKWKDDNDFGDERPLYDLFKQYFRFLDKGRQGTTNRAEIYAYNGGLFKEDTILDSLEIDNELLHKYAYNLAKYDFDSQVDVNILGHIFENSLNEIESINAEIQGADFDKQKSKRKKDGVFYTPKYITKYIVENTIGKLCEEQKATLGLKEEEYYKGRKNRNKITIQKLVAILDDYREWLLQLTICDPACGSGAFLNQALDFLINEHNYIDELKAKILGGAIVFSDIENTILENNIYGVDLNEESVEIAKLSLWLRTAQPRRKLNDLSSNIKCGNSLIDSKTVAGDKAFVWETEFPQVFKEKHKKAYHITTAIHDSRTSARMEKYKVRERRDMGTNPYPNVIYFTPEDDLVVTQTIATIVKEDNLNVLAYNICADHIHLLLVCDIDEIPAIMQKIKSVSAKHVNATRKHVTREHAPLHKKETHAPLHKKQTQASLHKKNKPLWQQKYSAPKEVTTTEQLHNTIKYIQTNRNKHELPKHGKEVQNSITEMCCTTSHAFDTKYIGGFDVVIGNPPYVFGGGSGITNEHKKLFKSRYVSGSGKVNLFTLFVEKGVELLKPLGRISYIIPNTFLRVTSYSHIRKYLLDNTKLTDIVDLGAGIFDDAVTSAIIFVSTNSKPTKNSMTHILKDFMGSYTAVAQQHFINSDYLITTNVTKHQLSLLEKLDKNAIPLGNFCKELIFGVVISGNKDELVTNVASEFSKPFLEGKDIGRYSIKPIHSYLKYIPEKIHRPRSPKIFDVSEKLLIQRITGGSRPLKVAYDNKQYYNKESINNLILKDDCKFNIKGILGLLNSRLISWFYSVRFTNESTLTVNLSKEYLSKIPINKGLLKIEKNIIQNVDLLLKKYNGLTIFCTKFSNYIEHKYNIKDYSTKLQNWHELSFGDFIKELNKAIKTTNKTRAKEEKQPIAVLTKSDEFEWLELFEDKKKEANQLQAQISATDKEIDQMVYELYGLTEDEITIVENS